MSEAKNKIINTFAYLIPSIISNVLPIFTFPIITRFLSPADFGTSALLMSTATIVVSFVACNIDSGVQRYYFEYRKDEQKLGQLINTSMLFLIVAFLLSLFVIFAGRGFLARLIMGSAGYSSAFMLAYATCFFSILSNYYLLLLRNMEKAKEFSFYTTLQTVLNIGLTLTLVVGFRSGYVGLILPTLISSLVIFAVLFYRFLRQFPFGFNAKMLVENLWFGLQLLPNMFTGSIYGFFDKYMLRSISSISSTGIFSVGQNISNKVFVFMTAVQSTFYPIFMKEMFDNGKEGARAVGRNFTVFTYICLAAILPAVLFGEEIIYILAPKSYYEVIGVLMILLGGIATQTYGKILGAQMAYAKIVYLSFPISVVGVVINVAANLLLIPRFGAAGAALATTATIVGMNYLSVVVTQRKYRIIYENEILFYLYANLLVSTLALLYLNSIGSLWALKYAVKLLSLGGFLLIGVRANILSRKNIGIIFDILKFKKKAEITIDL